MWRGLERAWLDPQYYSSPDTLSPCVPIFSLQKSPPEKQPWPETKVYSPSRDKRICFQAALPLSLLFTRQPAKTGRLMGYAADYRKTGSSPPVRHLSKFANCLPALRPFLQCIDSQGATSREAAWRNAVRHPGSSGTCASRPFSHALSGGIFPPVVVRPRANSEPHIHETNRNFGIFFTTFNGRIFAFCARLRRDSWACLWADCAAFRFSPAVFMGIFFQTRPKNQGRESLLGFSLVSSGAYLP